MSPEAVGVASTAAAPASQTTSRMGSERAATSSGSSSRSAKNTERGLTSTAGTRSHQARSGESSSRRPVASNAMPKSVAGALNEHLWSQ